MNDQKMLKKLSALFLLFALVSVSVNAQGLYLRLGTGYAFSNAFTSDDVGSKTVVNDTGFTTKSGLYGGQGGGIPFVVDFGVQFNDNFAFQLGVGYQVGTKVKTSAVSAAMNDAKFTAVTNLAMLQPAFVMRTGKEGLQAYGRLGISLPFLIKGETNSESTYELNGSPAMRIEHGKIKGASQIGLLAALGLDWSINDQVTFFVEAQALAQRVKAKSGELTAFSEANVDLLEGLNRYDSNWNYVEELNSDSNNLTYNTMADNDKPKDIAQISQNLSSLSLKVGFSFHF